MKYDEKLASMYRNTVPLVRSGQVNDSASVVILDTRTAREFGVSHIPGAQFIDYDNFKPKDVAQIDKNAKVIVYCSVGYRSERIGEQMIKMGFQDVSNLYGGIFQWVNEGNPVHDAAEAPTDSVHTYNKKWSKWLKKGVKVYD